MNSTDWKAAVASLGCLICSRPACLHHVREGQGLSQRASDFLVVPLCQEHHQGQTGWHTIGPMGFYLRYKLDEMRLLAMTLEAVATILKLNTVKGGVDG